MADKGIIFSAAMVRALLDGRKTQTRRLLNSVRVFRTHESPPYTLKGEHLERALQNAAGMRRVARTGWTWEADAYEWQAPAERTWWMANVAYAPGDRLYVREAHGFNHYKYAEGKAPTERPDDLPDDHISYLATESDSEIANELRYRPSIHMPRWASRMWLAVTDVRVQRLQECSEGDALAEGIDRILYPETGEWGWPQRRYAELWDSLHTAEGERWQDNPWIVAVTFDMHRGNIDTEVRSER